MPDNTSKSGSISRNINSGMRCAFDENRNKMGMRSPKRTVRCESFLTHFNFTEGGD